MTDESLSSKDVAASLATSRELGSEYDDAVADALAERLEHTIDRRVEARIAATQVRPHGNEMKIAGLRFAMAVVSMVLAVPLTAIASQAAEEAGAAVFSVWLGIIAVNAVFLFATRRR